MTPMTIDRSWPGLFTPAETEVLRGLTTGSATVPARRTIARQGVPLTDLHLLTRGLAGRYRADRFGRRQLVGLQVPGDYLDLSGLVLGQLDYDLVAIGEVELCRTPHDRLQRLWQDERGLGDKLWRILLIEAAIHRYWIFRLGRLPARARVASFFCELLLRLYSRGLCSLDGFELPMTQTDLAECCGMTPVHINRMLGELRDEGICAFSQGRVGITTLAGLFEEGQYSWGYLLLAPRQDGEIREQLRRADGGPATRGPVALRTAARG